ncbi:MAG: hypothetical protein AABZ39_18170 [Spirochaetota bacterium]
MVRERTPAAHIGRACCAAAVIVALNASANAQTKIAEWDFSALTELAAPSRSYLNDKSGVKANIAVDREISTPDGKGALRIDVVAASQNEEGGDIQLIFVNEKGLQAKKKYRVILTMKANQTMMMPVKIVTILDGSPWSGVGNPDFQYATPTREWKTVKYTFTANADHSGKAVRVPCIFMGEYDAGTTLWISRIQFFEVQ